MFDFAAIQSCTVLYDTDPLYRLLWHGRHSVAGIP